MFMYSNGPVCTRRARTVRVFGSGVRSETQLQTSPFSSGCMVSRNRTVSPSRSRICAAEYSLNSEGHEATSLVISQTSSIGAAMTISFSVCAAMSHLRPAQRVGVLDGGAWRGHALDRVVGHRDAVPQPDLGLDLQHGQRVEAEVAEGDVGDLDEVIESDHCLLLVRCSVVYRVRPARR